MRARDPSLVLIARCDSRPKESLAKFKSAWQRTPKPAPMRVGVQLTEIEDFRRVGAAAPAPLVSMWPRGAVTAHSNLFKWAFASR